MGGASDADRQKARGIRRTPLKQRTPKQRRWLAEYEARHGGAGNGQKRRGVRVEIDTGDASADEARKSVKEIRAEGDRLDRVLSAFEGVLGEARAMIKDAHEQQRDVLKLLMHGRKESDRQHVESLIALRDALVAGAAAEGTLAAIKAAEAMDGERGEEGMDRDLKKLVMRELGLGGGEENPGPNGAGNGGGHG